MVSLLSSPSSSHSKTVPTPYLACRTLLPIFQCADCLGASPRPSPGRRSIPRSRKNRSAPATEFTAFSQVVRAFDACALTFSMRFVGTSSRKRDRSEEHTSELQSRQYLVCRL